MSRSACWFWNFQMRPWVQRMRIMSRHEIMRRLNHETCRSAICFAVFVCSTQPVAYDPVHLFHHQRQSSIYLPSTATQSPFPPLYHQSHLYMKMSQWVTMRLWGMRSDEKMFNENMSHRIIDNCQWVNENPWVRAQASYRDDPWSWSWWCRHRSMLIDMSDEWWDDEDENENENEKMRKWEQWVSDENNENNESVSQFVIMRCNNVIVC